MNKFSRILKHLGSTRVAARRAFPSATLQAIQSCIAAGEALHRAEVRVVVEAALPFPALLRGESARARAHELFSHYRIWDTEENSGVLVYVNLADHRVEIVTDRAVGRALKRADWEAVCSTITQGFAGRIYHDGILQALAQMNQMLALHFPQSTQHKNEISNRPLIL
ncbi:TPM domain-containing protein [Herbaspirillum sp. RV1423]|uniref:TPM domain-containing protein n=1 Tax=Herbaspirillum sp. RV1423 TaxID=1443993 RepID=UPI0004BC4546|nr:TPM domain-containing protein [Herbaspirillum sp. RV1423]